jgi:hypothetical protein
VDGARHDHRRLAEAALAAGRAETARAAFFRAANYHRNAGVMLMGAPLDPRLRASNAAQTTAFRQGAALLAAPPNILAIPFEGTTLPGYHFRAAGAGPRPTLILLGGYDGTAEELFFSNGAAALARGYDVLAFDGPGQGSALPLERMPARLAAGLQAGKRSARVLLGLVLRNLAAKPTAGWALRRGMLVHGAAGARTLFHARAFDWLDGVPARV